MLKKYWNDPVWSKVIATGILAAVASTAAYFLNWWPRVWKLFQVCIAFIGAKSSLPNWLIGVLCLFSISSLIIFGVVIWQLLFPTKPSVPSWRNYTSDTFFGLRWRWQYSKSGQISSPYTCCPICDYQVHPIDISGYRLIDHITFSCDSCGQSLGEFQESYSSLENKTLRFIQQKLRNNSWPRNGSA